MKKYCGLYESDFKGFSNSSVLCLQSVVLTEALGDLAQCLKLAGSKAFWKS